MPSVDHVSRVPQFGAQPADRGRARHARRAARGARGARGAGGPAGRAAALGGRGRAAARDDPARPGASSRPTEQFVYNADFHTSVIAAAGNAFLMMAAQPLFTILQTQPRPLVARRAASTGGSTSSTGRSPRRSRTATHETRRAGDALAPRVPAPALRAHVAVRDARRRAGVKLGLQGSGQLVAGAPDPGFFRAVAELAEASGYDSLWAGDHVSFHNPILDVTVALTQLRGRRPSGSRSARASCCSRSGTRASSRASSPRSTTSRAAGSSSASASAARAARTSRQSGVDPRERGARTDEAMLALRALFAGPGGVVLRAGSSPSKASRSSPRRPAAGRRSGSEGGQRPRARRRAGRLGDGWMPIWVSAEQLRRRPRGGASATRRTAGRDAGRDRRPPSSAQRSSATMRAPARCAPRAALRHDRRAAPRRPLLRRRLAGGVRGARARVRRRRRGARDLQHRLCCGRRAARPGCAARVPAHLEVS